MQEEVHQVHHRVRLDYLVRTLLFPEVDSKARFHKDVRDRVHQENVRHRHRHRHDVHQENVNVRHRHRHDVHHQENEDVHHQEVHKVPGQEINTFITQNKL